MRCTGCGKEISDNLNYCKYCGTPVRKTVRPDKDNSSTVQCPACGAIVKAENQFCIKCGHMLRSTPDGPGGKREETGGTWKKIAIIVLSIILAISVGLVIVAAFYFLKVRNSDAENRMPVVVSTSAEKNTATFYNNGKTEKVAGTFVSETETTSSEKEMTQEGQNNFTENVDMSHVLTAYASKSLSENNMIHLAERVLDGDLKTAWVEGADGQGLGESLGIVLDDVYTVNGFYIYAGYQKSDDLYYKNSRPKEIEILFSDGTINTIELEDVIGMQNVKFPHSVETSGIEITINSVYAGNKYEDTAISEIQLY